MDLSASHARYPVLYEDDELLILSKPAGTPSAPLPTQDSKIQPTMVDVAIQHASVIRQVKGLQDHEPGLLHRLDTGTSGVLAFAKTQTEFDRLRKLWSEHSTIVKTYRAWVIAAPGAPALPKLLDWKLAHDSRAKKRMIALRPDKPYLKKRMKGKALEARTRIQGSPPDLTIQIETGVMHQIRCHLSAAGYPIEGDPIYGEKETASTRLWLHAWKLKLPLRSGTPLEIVSALPDEWLARLSVGK